MIRAPKIGTEISSYPLSQVIVSALYLGFDLSYAEKNAFSGFFHKLFPEAGGYVKSIVISRSLDKYTCI
jgi:hypothetical protein